ncbi:MAG: hypothetical protein O7D91_12490, partial [Planctomycetota bacterium]|nr:hypothetical protein [Planctomycetota bacterium]
MRYFILMTLTIVGAWGSSSYGQSTLDYPVGQRQPHDVDSGVRDNQAEAFETVFENLVRIEDAAWLRIYFGEVTLAEGSYIRITSLWDGEVQKLDARELALWSNSSAYFNGNAVQVELVAGPGTKGNRVIIEQVAQQMRARRAAGGPGQCGICGSDDRRPSAELWSARLLPAGCTASVWNTGSCMVSAGHCVGGSMVMQFNVPDSNPNCTLNNPPVADQFPVASVQFTNGGVGNDWSVMTTGTNNLGQTIYERYGELRPISDVVGSVGEVVSVWGYGVDTTCTRSQTQQTSSGLIDAAVSTVYTFTVDVRGGNSGSGLILNDEIIGVVTHCPCPNIATSVDHAAFAAARDALCPEDATTTLPFIDEFPSTAINFGLWIGLEGASIDDQGAGEPSPPFSLNIDGSDEIRSANMDTTGGTDLALNYSWQQTGDGGNTPEADNPLMVEYFNDQGDWVEINSHPGGGPDAEPYEQVSLVLPVGALHGSFRFRFRGTGNGGGQPAGFDDWFIDDVCVGTVGECQSGQACGGPEDCNDGIPCTIDDCLSNFCVNTPVNAVCVDGIACTADFCLPGIGCESTPDDAACDDGNGCTLDSCDAGSGCANAPDVGQPCDDGMECT